MGIRRIPAYHVDYTTAGMAQGSTKKTWGERSDINLHIMINIRDCQKQLYPPKNREKGFRGEFFFLLSFSFF